MQDPIVIDSLVKHGKHFCVLPWVHFHSWPDGRVMPCCVADSNMPVAEIKKDEFTPQDIDIFMKEIVEKNDNTFLSGDTNLFEFLISKYLIFSNRYTIT